MNRKRKVVWAAVGLFVVGLITQPIRPVVVRGGSMSPTYRSGEWLLSKPIDRPLHRGDVVIADGPDGPVIKRVALVGGDRRVQFRSGRGWIDMTTFDNPRTPHGFAKMRAFPVLAGTVFLLGDNVSVSVDSRSFGPVPLSRVRRLVVDPRDPGAYAGVSDGTTRRWMAEAESLREWRSRSEGGRLGA